MLFQVMTEGVHLMCYSIHTDNWDMPFQDNQLYSQQLQKIHKS